ncbi:MAG: DUF4231 domain-containing protein [Cyanobacteria bacterium P01_F01_bin.116]
MSPASATPPNEALLKTAWQRQLAYDVNASRYQQRFMFLRRWLAILSVAVVVLSVLAGGELCGNNSNSWIANWSFCEITETILQLALLILPISITGLLAFSVRFDRGQNWILLRGNAEALKMEIYYYLTRVGDYSQNRDSVLSKRIKQLSQGLRGSPIHQAAMVPYEREKLLASQEDGYTDIVTAEAYFESRLDPQFDWYRIKAKKLARQLQILQTGVYIFGGLGTFVAALDNLRSWVAVTTTVAAAFTNYLEYKRVEVSLVGYNQAADTLYDIRAWWFSLSEVEREEDNNFSKLVSSCESVIHSENASWLQDMQDSLAQLYGQSEDDGKGG